MAEAQAEPKLLLPFLRPFYDAAIPLSWLIIRCAVGWNLLVHGWGKILLGPAPTVVKGYADMNFNPPELWYWLSTITETSAGIALILGLFTRFFAAAAAIEMLVMPCCTGATAFRGCTGAMNMSWSGDWFVLPSRCAAAGLIR
jgi:putative oxidoreductase